MTAADSTTAVETAFRIEFPRVVATLTRWTGDLDLAEELAQEALVDALRQWPQDGAPRNPGAWLTAVGKRKAVDMFRRNRTLATKYGQLAHELEVSLPPHTSDRLDEVPDSDGIEDDRLRMIFVACHPVLSLSGRVALTLRLVGGLTTTEIARAYVVPEATIAQRIVRAKQSIKRAAVPFEVPTGDDRMGRLSSVLEVIYLIFNEGYSATAGADWVRPELCTEALRLGRILAALDPDDPEVHGLVALMEFQSSRLRARTDPSGAPILLLDQDRRAWDPLYIGRAEAALARAEALAARRGPYTLQAAIAACHARAFQPEDTDWAQIAELYNELATVSPSPIVELNRAVAISRARGTEAALPIVDQLVELGVLDRYHLLHSVRGDMLDALGRYAEAADAFERGADLAQNARERALNAERARKARDLANQPEPPPGNDCHASVVVDKGPPDS